MHRPLLESAKPHMHTSEQRSAYVGYGLALLAHIIWGSYPVISKRLLQTVPPFSLIAVGYGVAILLCAPWVWATLRSVPRWKAATWVLLAAVAARSATNIMSIRYTLAIYVQLINLLTPFAVVLMGRALFAERVPPKTAPALALSTAGSALMLLGGGTAAWRLGGDDLLGIGLALASTLSLALYMLLTRRVQSGGDSQWTVMTQQMIALELMALPASLLAGEQWGTWADLAPLGWVLAAIFVLVNVLGGNAVQIFALRHVSTSLFSSLIGVRLVSALVLAALLLGERLQTIWQLAGALIVVVTVTWYVRVQARETRKSRATITADAS